MFMEMVEETVRI